MPQPNVAISMTTEEYEVMEHRLGWKHEYWDGHARLSLQESAVVEWKIAVDFSFAGASSLPEGFLIRQAVPQDREDLVKLFVSSFEDSTEYTGHDLSFFQQDASDSIGSFFGMPTVHTIRQNDIGLPEASFVVEHRDSLAAAILIRPSQMGPIIEPVMVAPPYQRLGLGGGLLQASIKALQSSGGCIHSQSHLCNPVSFAWHTKHGFEEVHSIYSASHRALHFEWQAKHYAHIGQHSLASDMRGLAGQWHELQDKIRTSRDFLAII